MVSQWYLQATARLPGALGIFQAYAGEDSLAAALDARLAVGKRTKSAVLAAGELRYGWLVDAAGAPVDEMLLAKPAEGVRTIMTHGGEATRLSVSGYLCGSGFAEVCGKDAPALERLAALDAALDPLLAGCSTETQVAAVLEYRRALAAGEPALFPGGLLATRRVLLAGPPNAGKSSILNRLAGYDRAFVHAEAGATLDVVDELADVGGYAVMVGDLPGYGAGGDALAGEAWRRAAARLRLAEAVWFVCDASVPWDAGADAAAGAVAAILAEAPRREVPVLVLLNKADLPPAVDGEPWRSHFPHADAVQICALPGGDAREKLGENMYRIVGD